MSRVTKTHLYFWGGLYSQWHECKFSDKEFTYSSSEQYMMAHKAILFNQDETFSQIMYAESPQEAKELGRSIQGFSDSLWDAHKESIVTRGNYLKFSQNPYLLKKLLKDKNLILVEASPTDTVWGIGLHHSQEEVLDENLWEGQNLLGICIMKARNIIIEENKK